jgi:hypothetical protein
MHKNIDSVCACVHKPNIGMKVKSLSGFHSSQESRSEGIKVGKGSLLTF